MKALYVTSIVLMLSGGAGIVNSKYDRENKLDALAESYVVSKPSEIRNFELIGKLYSDISDLKTGTSIIKDSRVNSLNKSLGDVCDEIYSYQVEMMEQGTHLRKKEYDSLYETKKSEIKSWSTLEFIGWPLVSLGLLLGPLSTKKKKRKNNNLGGI